jgi:hypothetical protein
LKPVAVELAPVERVESIAVAQFDFRQWHVPHCSIVNDGLRRDAKPIGDIMPGKYHPRYQVMRLSQLMKAIQEKPSDW